MVKWIPLLIILTLIVGGVIIMAIKHEKVVSSGDRGEAVEWNKDHVIENDTIKTVHIDIDADLPFNAHKGTGLADPTADQDAATKKYVDTNIQRCSLFREGPLVIPNDVWTHMAWTGVFYDLNTMQNVNLIEIKVSGYYLIKAEVLWSPHATGKRGIRIADNLGVTHVAEWETPGAAEYQTVSASRVAYLASGLFLYVQVHQDSGGNLNVWGDRMLNHFEVNMLR